MIVRSVQPDDASAPTKARDGESCDISTLAAGKRNSGIQIAQDFGIGDLGDDVEHHVPHMGHVVFSGIALARIERWRDRVVSRFREPAAEIANVLMNTENLVDHENDGSMRLVLRPRAIARNGTV